MPPEKIERCTVCMDGPFPHGDMLVGEITYQGSRTHMAICERCLQNLWTGAKDTVDGLLPEWLPFDQIKAFVTLIKAGRL